MGIECKDFHMCFDHAGSEDTELNAGNLREKRLSRWHKISQK
jgi:hypothetical protein